MDPIVYNHKRQVWLEEIAYRLYCIEQIMRHNGSGHKSKAAYIASVNKGVGKGEGKA